MIVTGGIGRLPNCHEEEVDVQNACMCARTVICIPPPHRSFSALLNSTAMHPEPVAHELIRARNG
eukprot:10785276-Alexandrium_andersonii.AAC.1